MYSQRDRRKQASTGVIIKGVLIATATIVGVIFAALVLSRLIFGDESNNQLVTEGPAASWQEMVTLALDAAAADELGAVPDGVAARALVNKDKPGQLTDSSIFEVDFTFVVTSGARSQVTMNDTEPLHIVAVAKDERTAEVPFTVEELDTLAKKMESVKLSPRDVFRKTLAEGLAYGKAKGGPVRVYVTLSLFEDWQSQYNVPIGYYVEYVTDTAGITLLVNPQSGEIVGRRELGVAATPTPIATP